MGFVFDALFGSEPEVITPEARVRQEPTLSPEQQRLMNELLIPFLEGGQRGGIGGFRPTPFIPPVDLPSNVGQFENLMTGMTDPNMLPSLRMMAPEPTPALLAEPPAPWTVKRTVVGEATPEQFQSLVGSPPFGVDPSPDAPLDQPYRNKIALEDGKIVFYNVDKGSRQDTAIRIGQLKTALERVLRGE